jgi:Uma2 family endonuclease
MTTTQLQMTADDLWRLPDDGMRHELIRGELTVMAPASGEHGEIAGNLSTLLGAHVRAKNLGKLLVAEPGFLLSRNPDTVRAPDAAFISKHRVPAEGLPKKGFVPFAPDIAIEVLSPSDSQVDVEEKVEEWLAAGAARVWVVNPRARTVTVHRSGRDPRVLRSNDVLDGEEVCPGFSVRVGEIFES